MKTVTLEAIDSVDDQKSNIEIRKLKPDFEDPGMAPRKEAAHIRKNELSGYWYLNPLFIVYSPEDSEEFARAIQKCQAGWYRLLSKELKNGWRYQKNQEQNQMIVAFEYDGVIIQNGTLIPFSSWQFDQQSSKRKTMNETRRSEAIKLLKQGNLKELEIIQQAEVDRCHLLESSESKNTFFILPHLTISAPPGNEFSRQSKKEQAAWNHTLKRNLSKNLYRKIPSPVRNGIWITNCNFIVSNRLSCCSKTTKSNESLRDAIACPGL